MEKAMIKADVILYMTQSSGFKKITYKSSFDDHYNQKPTIRWAKSLIKKNFNEFVINNSLVIIYQKQNGYRAIRSCTDQERSRGFSFKYLEIVIKTKH